MFHVVEALAKLLPDRVQLLAEVAPGGIEVYNHKFAVVVDQVVECVSYYCPHRVEVNHWGSLGLEVLRRSLVSPLVNKLLDSFFGKFAFKFEFF